MVNYTESYFTVAMPELWLFVLGGLFVASTLFFPTGVVGTLALWSARLRALLPPAGWRFAPSRPTVGEAAAGEAAE